MKIFYLVSRFPHPLDKGDKVRAYYQIKHLARNHDIYLCALSDCDVPAGSIEAIKPLCKKIYVFRLQLFTRVVNLVLALFKGLPFQVGYFYSRRVHKEISKIIVQIKPDLIFSQLIRTSQYVKGESSFDKMLDYQDAFSMGYERRIKNEILMRPLLKMEAKRLRRYESKVFDYFQKHIIITNQDRININHPRNSEIKVIRNGINTDYFKPKDTEKIYDLVFVGGMSYPPNVDAVEYIAYKIIPLLKIKRPEIKFLIAGASPARKVKRLRSENVTVTGWVDDIRTCYLNSKVFIAPMRIGIGLQNKLLEAMSMKLSCVTSPLANRALEATPGEDLLIGNSPSEYAHHIEKLLDDDEYASKIAMNGYYFIIKNYDLDSVGEELEKYMTE